MKKVYIQPSISVINIELENLLAASNFQELETDGIGVNDTPMSPESALSKEHNGIWD